MNIDWNEITGGSHPYTYAQWEERFKPTRDTRGDVLTFDTPPQGIDPKHLWTFVQGDMSMWILPGFHWVNRLEYYVTKEPWTDEDEDLVLCSGDFDCPEHEGSYDCTPFCRNCEGEQTVTEYYEINRV